MPDKPDSYRFENLPLRWVLTLWIPFVLFSAHFAATKHFSEQPLYLLLILAVAINGVCFRPPMIGTVLAPIATAVTTAYTMLASGSFTDDDDDHFLREELERADKARRDDAADRRNEDFDRSYNDDSSHNAFGDDS